MLVTKASFLLIQVSSGNTDATDFLKSFSMCSFCYICQLYHLDKDKI